MSNRATTAGKPACAMGALAQDTIFMVTIVPSKDIVDEIERLRDYVLKTLERAGVSSDAVVSSFGELIELVEEERYEWEKTLDFLMQKEFDE